MLHYYYFRTISYCTKCFPVMWVSYIESTRNKAGSLLSSFSCEVFKQQHEKKMSGFRLIFFSSFLLTTYLVCFIKCQTSCEYYVAWEWRNYTESPQLIDKKNIYRLCPMSAFPSWANICWYLFLYIVLRIVYNDAALLNFMLSILNPQHLTIG